MSLSVELLFSRMSQRKLRINFRMERVRFPYASKALNKDHDIEDRLMKKQKGGEWRDFCAQQREFIF